MVERAIVEGDHEVVSIGEEAEGQQSVVVEIVDPANVANIAMEVACGGFSDTDEEEAE